MTTKGGRIQIIQGGQYGSEAKGAIAAYLVKQECIDCAVRTGATNAGHTVYYPDPDKLPTSSDPGLSAVKMQQLPVGWVRPDTKLVLGAGTLIDPEILDREVAEVSRLTGRDVRERLYIDFRAGLHLPHHRDRSTESGRHHSIGATGKGCSEALIDKIRLRGKGYQLFGESTFSGGYNCTDTSYILNRAYDSGATIQLEGTQGQLLDLNFGPYPYTTHKPCGPAQWLVEAGLSPALNLDIVMVVRTFPIRVAGNSGPMPLEMSWPELARTINFKRAGAGMPPIVSDIAIQAFEAAVCKMSTTFPRPSGSVGLDMHRWTAGVRERFPEILSELHKSALNSLDQSTVTELSRLFEMTTVTKKLRRVGLIHLPTIVRSAQQVRPHRVALTFANYIHPRWWYEAPTVSQWESDVDRIKTDSIRIGAACGAPVQFMSFGPHSDIDHIYDTGR